MPPRRCARCASTPRRDPRCHRRLSGVKIVCDTRRGRALARPLPVAVEGWVPEHFYSEVLGVLRWQLLGLKLSEAQASVAVGRLGGWHLRHASVAPLVPAAWSYRHNLTAADALYVALAEQLGASLLTDDLTAASQRTTIPPSICCNVEWNHHRRGGAKRSRHSQLSPAEKLK